MTHRIAKAFAAARAQGRSAFVAYLCAGDPTPADTPRLVDALVEGGADVVELGVPFSDPVADGPVNQRAAQRALAAGTTPRGVLDLVASMRARGLGVPIVLFTYYNPIVRMGEVVFARRAAEAGVDAVLVVDLPVEEAGAWRAACEREALGTVFLVAPTTRPERLARIAAASTAFVYCVARLGVTGAPTQVPPALHERLGRVRALARVPVVAGFGLSEPEQVRAVAPACDGVVVGSALVRIVEEAGEMGVSAVVSALSERVRALRDAARAALEPQP